MTTTWGLGDVDVLWGSRWPLVALQVWIDELDAASEGDKDRVLWELPCEDCPKNTECLTAKAKEVQSLIYEREYMTRPRASRSEKHTT